MGNGGANQCALGGSAAQNMSNLGAMQGTAGHWQAAMNQQQYPQNLMRLTRTSIMLCKDDTIEVNGLVVHTSKGIIVRDDLYLETQRQYSLSGLDKMICECRGIVAFAPQCTHILGVLRIKGITRFEIDGHIVGSPLNNIMNKYLPTQNVIMAQDELIDAGFIEQAKL